MNTNRIAKTDLRFLLKDKYNWNGRKITAILAGKMDLKKDLELDISRDIELLKNGHPFAYVIGYADFLGCRIDLRYKPLIPRPETEYWVEKAIGELKCRILRHPSKQIKILDLFCGSGCIGISLLKHIPNLKVTFGDIDENALKQTKFNLELNSIPDARYKIVKSNQFSGIHRKFNYIFANPPYVGTKTRFGKEIFHEPSNALFAGEDGLDAIKPFLKEAEKFLSPVGKIYMEFGDSKKNNINRLLKEYGCKSRHFYKDQFSKYRWVKTSSF